MGDIKKHLPVKLIIGFIFRNDKSLEKARAALEKTFGRIDFQSQVLAFNHTGYYQEEMGKDLKRVFVSFQKHISAEKLTQIKIITNRIEERLADRGRRLINIDPGYLDFAKVVLASTKDYFHRIYLAKGIFAEITLFYRGKTFKAWEWAYPDYRSLEYISIFNQIRQIYARQIKNK